MFNVTVIGIIFLHNKLMVYHVPEMCTVDAA